MTWNAFILVPVQNLQIVKKYERAQYNPGQQNLTTTSVTIFNLKHNSKYKFKVSSKYMISKPGNMPCKFTELHISTPEAVDEL